MKTNLVWNQEQRIFYHWAPGEMADQIIPEEQLTKCQWRHRRVLWYWCWSMNKRPGSQPSAEDNSGLQPIWSHLWFSRGRSDGGGRKHLNPNIHKYQKTLSADPPLHRCRYAFAALGVQRSGDRWEKHVDYTTRCRTRVPSEATHTHTKKEATHSSGWIPIYESEETIRFPRPDQPEKYLRVTQVFDLSLI